MQLKKGSTLQGGKYIIYDILGQGGFGITYVAEQGALHRRVAVKEFFMKGYCERDAVDSQVTLGTTGSRDLVSKFKSKFIKEAQIIAVLKHPGIVSIYDVFEENGTAYFVMEFISGGTLADRVKASGRLSEADAVECIAQIGSALTYLHTRNYLHLDVKPSNILLGDDGKAVLIDFGVSKHYDGTGNQTSSVPSALSTGYAPLEQYQQSEMVRFTPATDVYSLGATLYYLLLGEAPPSASELNEFGFPAAIQTLSPQARSAIVAAMSPRRRDRPQTVAEFLSLLDVYESDTEVDDEETIAIVPAHSATPAVPAVPMTEKLKKVLLNRRTFTYFALFLVAGCLLGILLPLLSDNGTNRAKRSKSKYENLVMDCSRIISTTTEGNPTPLLSAEALLLEIGQMDSMYRTVIPEVYFRYDTLRARLSQKQIRYSESWAKAARSQYYLPTPNYEKALEFYQLAQQLHPTDSIRMMIEIIQEKLNKSAHP